MVGTEVPVFAAIEVKSAKGEASEQQKAFIEHIRNAGGIAGVARSVDEARFILLS
jgi:hypothetical protein